MKYLIPLILLFPSLVFAVDDATITEIDSKASNVNAKADGNRGVIGDLATDIEALKAEDILLHGRIDTVESLPVGASPGDILYWDGSVWQLTPAPPAGATSPVTLTLIAGVPTWTEAGAGVFYAIGDTGPAGGVVFYVHSDGLHGLEAAPEDHASLVPWGCYGIPVGADGVDVGFGVYNTWLLALRCEVGSAAKVADAYVLNGYSDWFLPSRTELAFLYQQKDVVGGFFANDNYWSSTEYDRYQAWARLFNFGNEFEHGKDNLFRVRAVRAF